MLCWLLKVDKMSALHRMKSKYLDTYFPPHFHRYNEWIPMTLCHSIIVSLYVSAENVLWRPYDCCLCPRVWCEAQVVRAGPAPAAWQHSTLVTSLSWCLGKYKDAQPAPGTSQHQHRRQRQGDRERGRNTETLWREIIITTQWPVIQWWPQPCCGELRAHWYQVWGDRVK